MDRTRRGIFGHGDLDRYSLAEVTALKVLAGLECRKCRKFAANDVDELTRIHGCRFTLGYRQRRPHGRGSICKRWRQVRTGGVPNKRHSTAALPCKALQCRSAV